MGTTQELHAAQQLLVSLILWKSETSVLSFLIPVQAFLCVFSVNSGIFQLLDVERESFHSLLTFFAEENRVKPCLGFPRPSGGFPCGFLLSHSGLQWVLFSFPRQLPSELSL